MLYILYRALMLICDAAYFLLVAYCVLSFVAPGSRWFGMLGALLSPIIAPFRGISRKLTARFSLPFDLSVLFAFIALAIVQALISRVYYFIV